MQKFDFYQSIKSEEYDKEDAKRAREKAEEVLSVAKDFLKYWFSG